MSLRVIKRAGASLPFDKELFLSLLSGLESGVATTTAVIVGLIISESSVSVVTAAAIVTVAVQAFNSAASRYTSMRASEEIDDLSSNEMFSPLINSISQFVAHALASIIPILPLYLVDHRGVILISSLMLAYITMFIIGGFQGIFLKVQARQNMIELLVTGSMVIVVGTIAGFVLR